MTGLIVPKVTSDDGPVPAWVPEAIRRTRRWPGGMTDSWPAVVPRSVVALRLVGSRLPFRRPSLDDGDTDLGIDGEVITGVGSGPECGTAAIALAPGRHTFTVRTGTDAFAIQPVVLDIREGTVVAVDVQPPASRLFDQRPPVIIFRVVPAGLSQTAISDAVMKPVSPGSRAEQKSNAELARMQREKRDEAAGESPWPASGRLHPALAPVTKTWVGTARRHVDVRGLNVGFGATAGVFTVVVLLFDRDEIGGLPFMLGGLALLGAIGTLLPAWAAGTITLAVDPDNVTLTRRGRKTVLACADIEWAMLSFAEDALMLAPRVDAGAGPQRMMFIDLASFTQAQRDEIRSVFRPRTYASREVPASVTLPYRVAPWTALHRPKSWTSRPGVIARLVWWTLAVAWVGFLVAVTAWSVTSGDPPWYVALILWITVLPLVVLMMWVSRYYPQVTVSVDAHGLRLDRARHPCTIAFAEIGSLTARLDETPGAVRDRDRIPDSLVIRPNPAYYLRTGTTPPGRWSRQWKLSRERFTADQFEEIAAYLAQGVEAAGGNYFP